MAIKILAVSGALRSASSNSALIRAAQELAPEGVEVEIFDGIAELPFFDQDLEAEPPASVVKWREAIAAVDGVLLATPEYNYSTSGVLKNAIDWASRPYGQSVLTHKPAALMGASASDFGTVRAQNHVRAAFHQFEGDLVLKPEVHIGRNYERFDADGRLVDETSRNLVAGLLAALALKIDEKAKTAVAA
jgi:chromate reductase